MDYFGIKNFTFLLLLLLTLEYELFISLALSKSIVTALPGYPGQLPFKLETGYVGIGEKEDAQIFYYFLESEVNPEEDPFIFHLAGGPGCSGVVAFLYQIGPLAFNSDHAPKNPTLELNPHSWTKMANLLLVDIPAGIGFSYATSEEGWISSDNIMVKQVNDFLRKFLIDHPKFLSNPLYISGISYMGIVTPAVTLEVYNANERGDQPTLNIQGYILCSPLTNKFTDFNSRVEFAHRMALISDDIYKSAIENCQGNYVKTDGANFICKESIERYREDSAVKSGRIQVVGKTVPVSYRVQSSQKISHFLHRHEPPVMALDVKVLHKGEDVLIVCKPASVPNVKAYIRRGISRESFLYYEALKCTSDLNIEDILEPVCNKSEGRTYCQVFDSSVDWLNEEAVQQALNIRPGTIGTWDFWNATMHYHENKNNTSFYAYDVFSSVPYHKKLVSKNCRALIFSGDHDMVFPYVGVEDWIATLNLGVDSPWKPFYVDSQVGGYDMTYAQSDFSLTFATVKGAGHSVTTYKPREAYVLIERWLASKPYSSAI